jgi:flagellar basal-body rod protein FlgC
MTIGGGMDTSASGLLAERLRLDVVANNIANVDTTSTPQGGPYRREVVYFAQAPNQQGVVVAGIGTDPAPFPLVYDPGNAAANAQGFVQMPNVNMTSEMVDMLAAARAYEANVTAFDDGKQMATDALKLGQV